ncbi:hypothetical protein N5J01_20585, partial [Stenotrophomonas sp. GD03701]
MAQPPKLSRAWARLYKIEARERCSQSWVVGQLHAETLLQHLAHIADIVQRTLVRRLPGAVLGVVSAADGAAPVGPGQRRAQLARQPHRAAGPRSS